MQSNNIKEINYYSNHQRNYLIMTEPVEQAPSEQCPHLAEYHKKHGVFSPNRIVNLFFLNGITSLLGWSVVLVSLDYFQDIYTDYNVFLYFPVPVFIGYVVVSLSFNQLSKKFSYKILVITGIIGTNVCVTLLLLLSIIFGKQKQSIGFWGSEFVLLFVGINSNFAQLSFFAMINYLGEKTVSRYTIGTAASGLSMTLLEIILAASLNSSTTGSIGIIVYLSLAMAFNFWDLYLNIVFFRSNLYKNKILSTLHSANSQLLGDNSQNISEQKSYFRWLWETIFAVRPYPIYILVNYIITFLLLVNIGFGAETGLVKSWSLLMMNLSYNLGDLMGKILGDFRNTFNSKSMTYLLFTRLFFFYTMIIMVKPNLYDSDILLHNNVFPYFDMILFGLTNGFVTNGAFILSFENAKGEYKKYAGVLGGILLQIGIMIGTFGAIPLGLIIKPNE